MKTLNFKVFAIALLGLIPINGCIETAKDPCKETQWEESEDPIIYVKASTYVYSFLYNSVYYVLSDASTATFTGTITKYYCSGNKSGSFDFSATQYWEGGFISLTRVRIGNKSGSFDFSATQYWEGGFISLTRVRIGGPYQFLFQNDADYLEVEGRIRLEFPDGSVFRPRESTSQRFYFKDIKLDVSDMAYYLDFVFTDTDYQKVNL